MAMTPITGANTKKTINQAKLSRLSMKSLLFSKIATTRQTYAQLVKCGGWLEAILLK